MAILRPVSPIRRAFGVALLAAVAFLLIPACSRYHPFKVSLSSSEQSFVEGTVDSVVLTAYYDNGAPSSLTWRQLSGPKVPLSSRGIWGASLDVQGLEVAADTEIVFEAAARSTLFRYAVATISIAVLPADMAPALGPSLQIGGACTDVETFSCEGATWTLYNVANRLTATTVGTAAGPSFEICVRGFIRDIDVAESGGRRYALLSMGSEGIAVVDVTTPSAMLLRAQVNVNYEQAGVAWSDGGGNITTDNVVSGLAGVITSMATDGTTLWIGNEAYGLHRTALSNLLGPTGPVLEADGTLLVESEAWTLQYAGEAPWGGPRDLLLQDSRLYVAQGFLGLGIFDPATLGRLGGYNLYTDASISEDWFLGMNPAAEVQSGFLDPLTGMPDYRQASFEVLQVWHGGVVAPTPWADFDRYGKYYYNAHSMAVKTFGGRTLAYIAYGLGGLVVVNVTSCAHPSYVGYAPAVPVHGPTKEIGSSTGSLYPHYGSGRLKEAGVIGVQVDGTYAYYTDHFGGLVILAGADQPEAHWSGSAAPYDNDTDGIPGNHVPSWEFVTSYNMSPQDASDEESPPVWMSSLPSLLSTGEIAGHAGALRLLAPLQIAAAGNVDVLLCSGAGGFSAIDLVDLAATEMGARFAVAVGYATTKEIGAAADGTPSLPVSMGHTEGVASAAGYLYVGDGPHGVLVWKVTDALGNVTDTLRLVANTLQAEHEVVLGGSTIFPATHTKLVVMDPDHPAVLAMCQTLGVRRLPIADVESGLGLPGAPLLLAPSASDLFEHNGVAGKVPALTAQDHAFDVEKRGTLAFVADGRNGLTVYDLSKDPSNLAGGFFVANLGGGTGSQPPLANSTGIALWKDPATGRDYAILAAGSRGVGVVDVTDPLAMVLIKVFEPIKIEEEEEGEAHVGAADGRAVDVAVIGAHAYVTYDSFGVLCYALADLIAPLPAGVSPTEAWSPHGFDHRPAAVGYFKLQLVPGWEGVDGGALNMATTNVLGNPVLYVGYGAAGLVRIDWSVPSAPALAGVASTVGECTAVTILNGRVYVADGSGGLAIFK